LKGLFKLSVNCWTPARDISPERSGLV
jgi:hypothetical protein